MILLVQCAGFGKVFFKVCKLWYRIILEENIMMVKNMSSRIRLGSDRSDPGVTERKTNTDRIKSVD